MYAAALGGNALYLGLRRARLIVFDNIVGNYTNSARVGKIRDGLLANVPLDKVFFFVEFVTSAFFLSRAARVIMVFSAEFTRPAVGDH